MHRVRTDALRTIASIGVLLRGQDQEVRLADALIFNVFSKNGDELERFAVLP
ncbi:MAG TPA: hypothetical protein VFD30_22185 [Terriglobia bacterium]|jgi:hypothetical protein|nr:hypothetical protein [Terriglobia bacterium]